MSMIEKDLECVCRDIAAKIGMQTRARCAKDEIEDAAGNKLRIRTSDERVEQALRYAVARHGLVTQIN